ncbi:CAP domain-containing protein [Maribacter sp. 2210JD10-5]|uniref:CAP domain-containing protein n=1 Tax=Maribacter sp. 2210JD10-5 TaxID=3386272 RepID=UPI0039BD8E4B
MRLLRAIPVLLVFVFSCTSETLEEAPAVISAENNVPLEQELLKLVNDHRVGLDVNVLQFSEIAYKYANDHNEYMIAKGSLSHDNFSSRASKIDSEETVEMVAENVAKDYINAQDAFNGWYDSSSHRKTMEGDFTHTAVSIKIAPDGKYYFTQIFYKK